MSWHTILLVLFIESQVAIGLAIIAALLES